MSEADLSADDYPLAENRPELVRGRRGKAFDAITLDAVEAGEVGMEDLRITAETLALQANIARAAGRPTLAENLLRAAELTRVPQDVLMEAYELLRPGRAADETPLLEAAQRLREGFNAPRMATFLEEAAEVYGRRGLFTFRY